MVSKKILSALFLLLIAYPAIANSQGMMQVPPPTGLWAQDTLLVNGNVTFHVRMTNTTGNNIIGYSNGFVVSSTDGALWDTLVGVYSGAIAPTMMEQTFINPFSTDGQGADTIGFGGFSLFTPGIPNGFDANVWSIEIGPIPASSHGTHICLDTTYYPTTGSWKWSTDGGDAYPEWGGPYCYVLFDPEAPPSNEPPVLAPIADQDVTEMLELAFTVSATDPDGTTPVMTISSPVIAMGAEFTDNGNGTGSFAWTTDNFSSGIYDAMFYATDAVDASLVDSVSISITVIDSNLMPFIYIFPYTNQISEGGTATIDVVFFDLDSTLPNGTAFLDGDDTLATNMVFNSPDSITPAGVFSSLTFLPDFTQGDSDPDFYILRFQACDEFDETLCSESQPAVIRVINVNRAPEWNLSSIPSDMTIGVGISHSFLPNSTDPDSDPLTLSLAGDLSGLATFIDNGGGSGYFEWTPTVADIGDFVAMLITTDGLLSDTVEVPITVPVPNAPPYIVSVPDGVGLFEDDSIEFVMVVADPEGDPLTLWLDPVLDNMVFTDNGDGTATVNFKPSFTQAGIHWVTFYASDGVHTISKDIHFDIEDRSSGEFSAKIEIDPGRIRVLSEFAIEPILVDIYFGNFTDSHLVADVDLASLMVNSSITPISTEVLGSHEGFTGQVLKVEFRVYDFIETYGLLFDTTSESFSLSGQFNDQVQFGANGEVVFIGHISGDANLDGHVDISDITFLVDYFFLKGITPRIPEVADINKDGKLDISDLTGLIDRTFHQ